MWITTVLVLLLLLTLAVFSICLIVGECYTYEFKNWFKNKKQRKVLDQKMVNMDEDDKLLRIQRSTKTSLRWFVPVHDRLRMKYGWYYRWHLNPNANAVHMSFLTIMILGTFVGSFLGLFGGTIQKAKAEATIVDCRFIAASEDPTNWDVADNWICGPSELPEIPNNTADRIFNVIIDSDIILNSDKTVASVTMLESGGNVFYVDGGHTLTISSANGGSGAFSIATAETFTLQNSSTLNIQGDVSVIDTTGLSVIDNNSTVNFSGGGQNIAFNASGVALGGNAVFSGSGTKVVSGILAAGNNLSVEGTAVLDLATNDPEVYINGSLTIANGATWTKQDDGIAKINITTDTAAASITDNNTVKQDLGILNFNSSSAAVITAQTDIKATSITVAAEDTLDISSRNFTLTGTGTPLTINGALTTTGSTVTYAGVTTATNITTAPYNNLILSPTGGTATTYNLTGNLTDANALAGDLTISTGATLDVRPASNDYNIYAHNITLNGTGNINATSSASTITCHGNWSQSGYDTHFYAGSSTIIFADSGTMSFPAAASTVFNNIQFPATGGTTYTINQGIACIGVGGSVTFGDATTTVQHSGGYGASGLRFYASGTPITYNGANISGLRIYFFVNGGNAVNIPAASYGPLTLYCRSAGITTFNLLGTISTTDISIGGDWANNVKGLLDLKGYDLTVTGASGIILGYSGSTVKNGVIQNTGGSKSTVNTTAMTIRAGGGANQILTNGVNTIDFNVSGNWSNSETTGSNFSNSTVTLNSGSTQTLDNGGQAFNNIIHSGAGTLQVITSPLDINGNFTNSAGIFDANGQNINVAGNWSNTATFTANSGTVTFDGTSLATISGNTTFNNLTFDSSQGAKTIKTTAGTTQTVSGTLSLSGSASDKRITYQSTTDSGLIGDRYSYAIPSNITNVNYVNVRDFAVSGGTIAPIVATSTDNGNNDGWLFNTMPSEPTSLDQAEEDDTPIATGSWINTDSVKFSASISDLDLDEVKLQIERQPIDSAFDGTVSGTSDSFCQSPCTNTITISGLVSGTQYHWQARAIDNSGATSAWVSFGGNSDGTPPGTPAAADFSVDTAAPTVNITAPVAGAFVKGTTIVSFTDTESTSPQCSINNINWSSCTSGATTLSDITGFTGLADGAFSLYLKDTDLANNTGTDTEAAIIKDITAPTSPEVTITEGSYTNDNSITLNMSATDATSGLNTIEVSEDGGTVWGDPFAYTEDPTVYTITGGTGNITIAARFTDNAGNVSAAASDSIIYDTAGPTKPGTPTTIAITNDTTPTWSWTSSEDSLAGVNSYSVRYGSGDWTNIGNNTTWTSTTLAEGSYSLTVKATDNATNESVVSDAGTVLIDTTPPTGSVVINGDEPEVTTAGVFLSFTASDTGGGDVSEVAISNNGANYSSWQSYGAEIEHNLVAGDGIKTVYIKFKDTAGNESSVYTDTILMDTTGPQAFSLYSPANNYWANTTSLQLTWEAASDLGSGLQKYQLYFDDALLDGNILSSVTSYDLTNLTLGQHTWQVKAIDNLTNETSSEKRTFGIDQSLPTIPSGIKATNLSNSELSLTKNSPVIFEWDVATDQGAGVGSYLVYVGSEPGKTDIVNGEEVSTNKYEAKLVADGYYYFSVKTKGRAGNLSAISSEYKVRFDSSAPSAITKAVVFDVSNKVTGSYAAYITWTSSSDAVGEGMKEYAIYLANEKVGTVSQEGPRYFVKNELKPGRYVFTVKGIDLAGNESASSPEAPLEISAKESNTLSITDIKSTPSTIVDPDSGNTSVLINWKTSSLATSVVEMEGKSYGEEDLSKLNTGHGVLITGLKASTSYQYKVISRDIYGNNITSESNVFRTNGIIKKQSTLEIIIRSLQDVFSLFTKASAAILEKIGVLKPTQVSKEGLIVYNVSDPELSHYNSFISLSKAGQTIEKSEDGKNFAALATPVENYYVDQALVPTKTYYYRTKGNDGIVSIRPDNNDTGAPEIINPKLLEEATQLSDDKAMIAISWQTSRPATSQVVYGPGEPSIETEKSESQNSSHLVILDGLQAGTEYKYKIKSIADNGVGAESSNLVFKTPQKTETKSVLEIIIKQFQDIIAKFSSWFRS